MKKLMTAISAIALSATFAQAQIVVPPPGAPATPTVDLDPNPVNDAWMSTAGTHPVLPPDPHNNPTPGEPDDPLKPGPLTIDMRMYKGCDASGQCAYVDQVGVGNNVDIDQTSAPGGSVADVIQVGPGNQASVLQLPGAGSHYAVITQNNEVGFAGNGAAIRQFSDTQQGATYADIQQGGDGTNGGGNSKASNNWASIDQGISAAGFGTLSYGNKAKIRQEIRNADPLVNGVIAQNNTAAIVQRGDLMLALIDQDGDNNSASILQTGNNGGANGAAGEFNEASITQIGFSNEGAIFQDGQFQIASIDQNGNSNQASIDQDGTTTNLGTVADANTALIDQDGDLNDSAIGQLGDGNMASSVQTGDGNFSSIWQDGDDNMAAATQTGDFNYSAIEQMGDGNWASVAQNGHDWADVQQHGDNNVAAVNQ